MAGTIKENNLRYRHILTAAAALALLAAPAAASAQTAPHAGPTGPAKTSQNLGGDAFSFGTAKLNSSRDQFFLTPLGASPALVNTVAFGDLLVQGPGGGNALAAGWVWHDTASTCPADTYTLGEAATTVASQMPVPPGALTPVMVGGAPVCQVSVWQYTEVHYSTLLNEFAVVNSADEANQQTVFLQDSPFGAGIHTFLVSGVGVDTTNGTAAAALTSGTVFATHRCGVTEVAGQNIGVTGGKRLTCDELPWTQYLGTVSGLAHTPGNPVTLQPSALPAPSSDITVTVP
jgi:hypothetical protein